MGKAGGSGGTGYLGDDAERLVQLSSTITTPGAQQIAGEAFRMNPGRYDWPCIQISLHQYHVLVGRSAILENHLSPHPQALALPFNGKLALSLKEYLFGI